MVVGVSVLTLAKAFGSPAGQTDTTAKPDKTYTGTVTSVDPKEHTLDVKGFAWSKKFNLGDSCTFALLEKPDGALADLHTGQKVSVGYLDASGVLVADRVQQEPMNYEGMVKAIDPAAHTMTVHLRMLDKTFQLADDCKVVLRNDKSGTLADIKPGSHVTVTYEIPGEKLTARQIAQTSTAFTGTLTAIDLDEKTVKAKSVFNSKKFNVGDNCAIVLNGKPGAELRDLKPGDRLEFSYDTVNGINVVNRIGVAEKGAPQETASLPMQ